MEPSQKKHDTKLGKKALAGAGDKGSFLQNTLKSSNCEFAALRSYGILV